MLSLTMLKALAQKNKADHMEQIRWSNSKTELRYGA
jgi:hypothetical protein